MSSLKQEFRCFIDEATSLDLYVGIFCVGDEDTPTAGIYGDENLIWGETALSFVDPTTDETVVIPYDTITDLQMQAEEFD